MGWRTKIDVKRKLIDVKRKLIDIKWNYYRYRK